VPDTQAARRCIVSGRVQGVFFRASTARRARELGLVGHAINLEDGTVEVLAIGPRAPVESLCDWLRVGPPAARVERVEVVAERPPDVPPDAFSTG
jgi:acylphosphatase